MNPSIGVSAWRSRSGPRAPRGAVSTFYAVLAELQAQVDVFDDIYDTERPPPRGTRSRHTPQAWGATPKAEAPRRSPDRPFFVLPVTTRPTPGPSDLPCGTRLEKLTTAGTFMLAGVHCKVDGRRGLEQVVVITDGDKITVADLQGEILIEHTRPAPGVTYVGNGSPRGRRPKTPETSPKS